jgi:translin
MDNLDSIAEKIRAEFTTKNAARDLTLARSRELIRFCSLAIRATHREEFAEAEKLLATARAAADEMTSGIAAHPDLYYTGYTQDALKELAEAYITFAVVNGRPLPTPEDLGVDGAAYLNGLCEAASELRRRTLDIIRHGRTAEGERLLAAMDDVYGVLVTMDFPTPSRATAPQHRCPARVLERTRGDLTNSGSRKTCASCRRLSSASTANERRPRRTSQRTGPIFFLRQSMVAGQRGRRAERERP